MKFEELVKKATKKELKEMVRIIDEEYVKRLSSQSQ